MRVQASALTDRRKYEGKRTRERQKEQQHYHPGVQTGAPSKCIRLRKLAAWPTEGLGRNSNDFCESPSAALTKGLQGRLEASGAAPGTKRSRHPDQLGIAAGDW